MNLSAQRVSLWLTAACGAVLVAAFVMFPGFFPPMSPDASPARVAAFYSENRTMVRTSMILFNLFGVMLVPFFMLIVYQIKRMATPSQVFAYSYLSAAASGTTLFAIADLFWLIAAFRPERDPHLIVLLNDMAWIMFTAPVGMYIAQNVSLALAVYLDRNPEPIFPRWVGAFNIAVAVVMVPSAFGAIVHTGPFAWDGFVSFWLRIGTYALYIAVMFFVLRAAISREESGDQRGATAPEPVAVAP